MIEPSQDFEEIPLDETTTRAEGSCCKPAKDAIWSDGSKVEVQAFYFNCFGRSILFISITFLSLAILDLANKQAQCPKDENGAYENCGNRVYGTKPSSMLALMATVDGVITAMSMPYAGAVVDYTPNRREFGKAVAFFLVLSSVIQIFLFDSTWFSLAIMQAILTTASFSANSMVMWSYVKDLADSDHALHSITASGRLWDTIAMFGFLFLVTLVGLATGWDAVSLARFFQALAAVIGGTFLWLSYSRYGPRPTHREPPKGKGLYMAGLFSLYSGVTELGKTASGAKRILLTNVFAGAAALSFSTIGVTYLKEHVKLTDFETQLFLVITLVCGIPGALFHRTIARRISHKKGYLACLTYWIAVTILFIIVLSGPSKGGLSFLFAILFSVGFGWYYPSTNDFFVSLVPDGRDVEMWGWNNFASVSLSWIPPLIFTGLNEAADDLKLGVTGLISFHFTGLLVSSTIDCKYEEKKVTPEVTKMEESPFIDL